jgi:hypothetical protein
MLHILQLSFREECKILGLKICNFRVVIAFSGIPREGWLKLIARLERTGPDTFLFKADDVGFC